MKSLLFFFTLSLFCLPGRTQGNLGFMADGGIARVDYPVFYSLTNVERKITPSYRLGVSYRDNSKRRLFFDIQLIVNYLEGKASGKSIYPEHFDYPGTEEYIFYNEFTHYLSIPFQIGWKLGNWDLSLGPEISFYLWSQGKQEVKIIDLTTGESKTERLKYNISNISPVMLGGRFALSYTISSHFNLMLGYGLSTGNESEQQKFHQLTLGLRYSLMVKEQED